MKSIDPLHLEDAPMYFVKASQFCQLAYQICQEISL
jgi:hypothetical protein